MKKDRECLQSMIQRRIDNLPSGYEGLYIEGSRDAYELVLQDIDQLDEPEVSAEDYIDENKEDSDVHYIGYCAPIGRVHNPILPTQELPVIPKYVAEFIEEVKASGDRLDDAFSILRGIYHQSKTADWVAKENRNSETFARAWLDGYEVKEEQKYVIKLPMSTNRDMDFALVDDKGDIWVDAYPSKYKLTEQEILSLPKGDVYFKYFSEPVGERE